MCSLTHCVLVAAATRTASSGILLATSSTTEAMLWSNFASTGAHFQFQIGAVHVVPVTLAPNVSAPPPTVVQFTNACVIGATACPGMPPTENVCYGHGACWAQGEKAGACICEQGYAGVDERNRTSCSDCTIGGHDRLSPSYFGNGESGSALNCTICPGGAQGGLVYHVPLCFRCWHGSSTLFTVL